MEWVMEEEPNECVYCGSLEITARTAEQQHRGTIERNVVCEDCHRYWTEIYNFAEIVVPDPYVDMFTRRLG